MGTGPTGRPFRSHTVLGKLMLRYGLSVRELEHRSNVSYRSISDYLAGRKQMTPSHLAKFSQLFGVEPVVLQIDPDRDLAPDIPHKQRPAGGIKAPAGRIKQAG